MNTLTLFFTPIVYESAQKTWKQQVAEACDNYFYLGGKKICLLNNKETRPFEQKPSFRETLLTALKVTSYFTIVLPTFFFFAKLAFRPNIVVSAPVNLNNEHFTKLFNAPYDEDKLRHFGLSNLDIEKASLLNSKLRSMTHENLEKSATSFASFRDLQRLFSHNWLNDTCVNEHLRLQIADRRNFCFINSLSVANHKLTRITKLYPIFQTGENTKLKKLYETQKTLLMPLHVGNNHWTLLVADIDKRTLSYYDSLSLRPPEVIEELQAHLKKIALHENVELAANDFTLVNEPCPQQSNGYDCGVFVLLAAKHTIEGTPLEYSQRDAPYMRLKILSDFCAHLTS